MDLANTAVARADAYLAAERGEPIPEGWAADAHGNPTTDPVRAIDGLILPMAGAKGYVISFMMDVLAGVLTGSTFEKPSPVPTTRIGAAAPDTCSSSSTSRPCPTRRSSLLAWGKLVDQTRSGELTAWAVAILGAGGARGQQPCREGA